MEQSTEDSGAIGIITEQIREKALSLGFNAVGIARPAKVNDAYLRDWLENSYQAGMNWFTRSLEKRCDPEKYFPGVKSIIPLAINYYAEDEPREADSFQVSRYAVNRDYHLVFEEKLPALLDEIKKILPGVSGVTAVDYAPVLDKIWAAAGGIGWIGKHSNVISREFGSYIFLGEILLDRELEFDKPSADHCGTCRLCIDACPTGAIVEPYVVDSNRCISYRTIEHKGDFGEDIRNGDWVFGCDVCQEVCPWNGELKVTKIAEFLPISGRRFPNSSTFAQISEDKFKQIYNESPIKRAKLSGMIRNVENSSSCAAKESK